MAKGIYSVKIVASNGVTVHQETIQHPGGNAAYYLKIPVAKGIYTISLVGNNTTNSRRILVK